jgi:hypothetical protein
MRGFQEAVALHRPPVTFEWRPDVVAQSDVGAAEDLRPLFPEGYEFFGVRTTLVDRASATLAIELSDFSLDGQYENVLAVHGERTKLSSRCSDFVRMRKAEISLARLVAV